MNVGTGITRITRNVRVGSLLYKLSDLSDLSVFQCLEIDSTPSPAPEAAIS